MDEFLRQATTDLNLVSAVDIWDLVLVLALSAVLSVILAQVYVYTHRGVSYSRSFVHTIVFVGITVSLIMVIIGSNIARAFALVGSDVDHPIPQSGQGFSGRRLSFGAYIPESQ